MPEQPYEEPKIERPVTHHGKPVEDLGPDEFGVMGEQRRFTREEVVDAEVAFVHLLLQTTAEDPLTPTTEIEELLGTAEIIRTTGSIRALLVPRIQGS